MKRGFNETYKSWRNKLRKYSLVSIVNHVLKILHSPSPDNIEDLRKAPWLTLLLLKWACQDRMIPFASGQSIPMTVMDELRQELWDFPSKIVHRISDDQPAYLFLRQLLRPQVDLQRRVTLGFVREAALLASQPENSRLRRTFRERTGLTLEAFIDLAFCTYAAVLDDRKDFPLSWFESMRGDYGEYVDRFIELVSTDLDGLVAYFRSLPNANQKVISELFEFPVVKRHPFLRVGNQLFVWHAMVFFRGMEGLVHSVMSESGSVYMHEFSALFEKHVISELRSLSGSCFDENELIEVVPNGTKVVDGLLSYPGVNVYIEAKTGMFAESLMVVGSSRILKSKTTMLRVAIEQATAASNGLRALGTAPRQVLDSETEFLLVVTSKELSAGRGDRLFSMYGEEVVEDSTDRSFPLSHVYYVSIEDFERLIRGVGTEGIDLPEFLARCVQRDSDPSTSVFFFEQHLDSEGFPRRLSALVEQSIDAAEQRLVRVLPQN